MKVRFNGTEMFEVSAKFGAIDEMHKTAHTGVDLVIKEGTRILSPTNGVIENVVNYGSENIGKGVIIRTEDGERLILGHLSDTSSVKIGQTIHTGDYLALSGNTGYSSGPHLHIGLRDAHNEFINPSKYLGGYSPPEINVPKLDAGNIFQQAMEKFTEGLPDMTINFIQLLGTHIEHLVSFLALWC